MASILPNSTTLAKAVSASDTYIPLTSVSNINKGDVLFVDLEAMPIARVLPGTYPGVVVTRTGRGASHGPAAPVYTGPPANFQAYDPVGVPPAGSQLWWINTRTGAVWVAQGDEAGPGSANRFWQQQVTTPSAGALGVRVTTVNPT